MYILRWEKGHLLSNTNSTNNMMENKAIFSILTKAVNSEELKQHNSQEVIKEVLVKIEGNNSSKVKKISNKVSKMF